MIGAGVTQYLKSHERRASGNLAGSIRQTAAELFEIPYNRAEGERSGTSLQKPYGQTMIGSIRFLRPGRGHGADPAAIAAGKPCPRPLKRQIDMLVMRNLENLPVGDRAERQHCLSRKLIWISMPGLAGPSMPPTARINAALEERKRYGAAVAVQVEELKRVAGEIHGVIDQFGTG